MKHIYRSIACLFACILLSLSASAANYVLVGAYNSWNLSTATAFQAVAGTTNEWTITIPSISGEFKVVDADYTDWSVQYGAWKQGDDIKLHNNYGLRAKSPSVEPKNLVLGSQSFLYTNAQLRLVLESDNTMRLYFESATASLNPSITMQLIGSYCDWALDSALQFAPNDQGVLSVTVPIFKGQCKVIANRSWTEEYASAGGMLTMNSSVNLTRASGGMDVFLTNPFAVYHNAVFTLTFDDSYNPILSLVSATQSTTEFNLPSTLYLPGAGLGWNFESAQQLSPVPGQDYTYTLTAATFSGDLKLCADNNWNWFFGRNEASDPWTINQSYTMGWRTDNLAPASTDTYTNVTILVVLDPVNGTATLTIRDANYATDLREVPSTDIIEKRIENGQIVIIKNNTRYSLLGARL